MKYLKDITDWQELKNQVVCGDCLEGMKLIPDNSIDLIITSPPYNLGNNHHTGSKKTQGYSDAMLETNYQQWQTAILKECYRILMPDGSMFYNHKNRIKDKVQITPYEWLLKSSFYIKQELVWFNRSQNFDKCRFYPMTERVYWLSKGLDVQFQNTINAHDLFKWTPVGSKGEHTRQYPIQLPIDIIKCFTNANLICDPFMGSWTTARACKDLGRDFIGFELSEDYCKIGEKRLQQEVLF